MSTVKELSAHKGDRANLCVCSPNTEWSLLQVNSLHILSDQFSTPSLSLRDAVHLNLSEKMMAARHCTCHRHKLPSVLWKGCPEAHCCSSLFNSGERDREV